MGVPGSFARLLLCLIAGLPFCHQIFLHWAYLGGGFAQGFENLSKGFNKKVKNKKETKQAGAELGQAQIRLELGVISN